MGDEPKGLRWAVNSTAWAPTVDDLAFALACVQPEERDRIGRFYFQRDAKLALLGRLLLRMAAAVCYGISWANLRLGRTPDNKPYLENAPKDGPQWSLNISHHGDYVVLAAEGMRAIMRNTGVADPRALFPAPRSVPAPFPILAAHTTVAELDHPCATKAEPGRDVGVDIMTVEPPVGDTVQGFFELMRPQFSASEWEEIHTSSNPLEEFYRFWTLKECYIKAIGKGLQIDLASLSFAQPQRRRARSAAAAPRNEVETETVLHVCGTLAKGWVFEQSYLDPVHCVAVALAPRLQNARADAAAVPASTEGRAFEVLGLQELLKHAQPLRPPEQTLAKVILGKPVAP